MKPNSLDHSAESLNQEADDISLNPIVAQYQNKVRDIIAWIYKKEAFLHNIQDQSPTNESSCFDDLIHSYSEHEEFISNICHFANDELLECKKDGIDKQRLDILTREEKDEIGIHIDAMTVLFEKLKILSFDRLMLLRNIIEKRQLKKVDSFNEWLTKAELSISRMTPAVGPDESSIKVQIEELKELKNELEHKQEVLNFMSKTIIFNEIDPETLQVIDRPTQQFDEQFSSINQRWTKICRFVYQREENLEKAAAVWCMLNLEGPQIKRWFFKLEKDLNEMLTALKGNIELMKTDSYFVDRLVNRSSKIEADIKSKQSLYSSLEHRLRSEVEKIKDLCPLIAVEVGRKMNELQDNWNSMLNLKRNLDYYLQNESIDEHYAKQNEVGLVYDAIPISDTITKTSRENLKNNIDCIDGTEEKKDCEKKANETFIVAYSNDNGDNNSRKTDKYGGSTFDLDSIQSYSRSDDTFTCPRSAASISAELQIPLESESKSNYLEIEEKNASLDEINGIKSKTFDKSDSNFVRGNKTCCLENFGQNGWLQNGCRVEQWKVQLEEFVNWLKQTESILDDNVHNSTDYPQSWRSLDMDAKVQFLSRFEYETSASYCNKFQYFMEDGKQIISEFTSQIESEDEMHLISILKDLNTDYESIASTVAIKRKELVGSWATLLNDLIELSDILIERMGQLPSDSDIGYDLISLAQEKDVLIRMKSDLNGDERTAQCIGDAKTFLKLYDRNKRSSQLLNNLNEEYPKPSIFDSPEIESLKNEIENQYDRLTLHLSELIQLIEEKLERCDNIRSRLNSLQLNIQDFAEKLQLAEIMKSTWCSVNDLTLEQLSEQLENIKEYKDHLNELEATRSNVNSIVESFLKEEVPISQQILNRTNELDSYWRLIESSADQYQKQVEQAFENEGSSEQQFLCCTVDLPWERRVATISKVPYFKNRDTNETQWDHPKLNDVLVSSSQVLDQIVYSAYRTALKLRQVQRKLEIDLLMLEQLKDIFSKSTIPNEKPKVANIDEKANPNHPVAKFNNNTDALISVKQVINYLEEVFDYIKKKENPSLNAPIAIDLTLNWLLKLYDPSRTGYIALKTFKIALTLLCCATLEEKYNFMFQIMENEKSKNLDARKLEFILDVCMRIPQSLGEAKNFSSDQSNIEKNVRECFESSKYNPKQPNSITLADYLSWLRSEPECIVWLTVFHRILKSESAVHNGTKCKICSVCPIKGLRYKSLKNFKFDLCQNCFLTGRHIFELNIGPNHPIRQYIGSTTTGQKLLDFTKIVRNKARSSKKM